MIATLDTMSKKLATDKAETEQINIRLPSALLDKLDRIGEPLGLKRSYLVQQAIVEYVQRQESVNAKPPLNDAKPKR